MDGYRTTVLSGWYSRYVAAVGVIAAAAIVALATTQAAPPVAPVLILGLLLVAALPTGVAWFAVNVCLVSLAVALYERARPSAVLRSLLEWHWHIYPFAVLGVFLGRLYLDVGPTIVVLVVTPVLAARGTFASYARVREAHEAALRTLVLALESKDPYTAGHVERVATYADYIAEELGLRPAARRRVRGAALMHDIGKFAIPNQLLNKPDRLTATVYERVRTHEAVTF